MAVTQGCVGLVATVPNAPVVKTGKLTINVSASTSLPGTAPAVGMYAQATGTGSCTTSITATSITLTRVSPSAFCPNQLPVLQQASALPPAQCISGGLIGVNPKGFDISSTSCHGRIGILTNPATTVAGPPSLAAPALLLATGPQTPQPLGPANPIAGPTSNTCLFSASSVILQPSPTQAP
jgi:hypothetical protein